MANLSTPTSGGKLTELTNSVATSFRSFVSGYQAADWFGPGQPMVTMAPSDTDLRRFDYQFNQNINYSSRRDLGASGYDEVRGLAQSCDIVRIIIETRKDQLSAMEYAFRPKARPGETQESIRQRGMNNPDILKMEKLFANPDREPGHGFNTWIRAAAEEVFVTDSLCIYPRRTRGGDVYSLNLIDGTTIVRLIDDNGLTPVPPIAAYQQILKGMPATDWRADQLVFAPRNWRVNKLYGFSPVEQIVMIVLLSLNREASRLSHYTDGNVPEMLISLPESWNADQIKAIQMMFDAMAGRPDLRSRIRFIPEAKAMTQTKESMLKDDFDEWIARVACYAFSVSPTAFTKTVNRATAEVASENAREEGLFPLLRYFEELINNIIQNYMSTPDVEFVWKDKEEPDQLKQAQIFQIYVQSADPLGQPIMTANEVREKLGMDPHKPNTFPLPTVPGVASAADPAGNSGPEGLPAGDGARKLLTDGQETTKQAYGRVVKAPKKK